MKLEIREIKTLQELEQVQEVEEAVWLDKPTPIHQTYTAINNGGVIIGAFLGVKMIGFQYSFAGFKDNKAYLVSHSLGVLPDYRQLGLGAKIKHKQAEVAAEKGYDKMIWTFDPLESVNAYLNLHKLGGVITTYLENHYGEMDDGLNKGMPSDRFQVDWYFLKEKSPLQLTLNNSRVLLDMGKKGEPVRTTSFDKKENSWFVAIPANIQETKLQSLELAIKWRLATREVFQLLLANNYKGRDIIRGRGVSYYCFVKEEGKEIV